MRFYTFNSFLKERFGERVQKVTLDAGLTCPNRDGTKGTGGCVYCDARGSGTGVYKHFPDLTAQAHAALQFQHKRSGARKFIMYFQSFCNTYGPRELLQSLYDEVVRLPGVVGLSVATRPDCLEIDTLELLAGYSSRMMVWLELGLQSADDETLRRINRGHTFAEFLEGYRLARTFPLMVCLHVIIGLPGEYDQHVAVTAREVARLKPDGLKIHSLYIHKNTPLEKLYREGHYLPLTQQEFVRRACDFLELIPPKTIIQRMTGDPVRSDLVAPEWALHKQQTLRMIAQELEFRGSRQGSRCAAPPGPVALQGPSGA